MARLIPSNVPVQYTVCTYNLCMNSVILLCWSNITSTMLLSDTPLDCEVSAWSPWGLCKGKCGESGLRHRTRYIHLHPANNGAECPPLEEERKCTMDNCVPVVTQLPVSTPKGN